MASTIRKNDARKNYEFLFAITMMMSSINRSECQTIKHIVGNEGETVQFGEKSVTMWEKHVEMNYNKLFLADFPTRCMQEECKYTAKFNTTGDDIGTFTIRNVQVTDSAIYNALDDRTWHPKVLIYFRVLSVKNTNCTFTEQRRRRRYRRQLTSNYRETELDGPVVTGDCNIVLRSNIRDDDDNENLLRGTFVCGGRNAVNVRNSTIVKFEANTELSLRDIRIVLNRNNNDVFGRHHCYLEFEIVDGSTGRVFYVGDRKYYHVET